MSLIFLVLNDYFCSLRDWEKENSDVEQERNNDLDFNIREITWDIKI